MDTRVARCVLLADVLSADGIMTAEEKEFLARAMKGLELDQAERGLVYAMTHREEALDVIRPLPEEDRRSLADELVAATLADGKLSPHETKAVQELLRAIGLEP